MGEVIQFDSKLGWYIVVDGNFGCWYKTEEDICKDFDIPE